jgi:hypothetical protein
VPKRGADAAPGRVDTGHQDEAQRAQDVVLLEGLAVRVLGREHVADEVVAGRGAPRLQVTPELGIILGVAYWDRVDDIFIPYGGITWNPSEYWRFALTFPKGSINAFLLNWGSASVWLYGAFEYHVEAYQIDLGSPTGRDEKIQLADFRAVLGLRLDGEKAAAFLEGGSVFDRRVKFLHGTPGFDIDNAGIIRFGLLF